MTQEQLDIAEAILARQFAPRPRQKTYGITADNLNQHITHRPMQAARATMSDADCRSLGFTLDQGD